MVTFFINAAYNCFELGNFNSTMAIIAAMNFLHISRLKKTWQKVDTSKLDILSANTDSSNNYFIYRRILEENIKNTENAIVSQFIIVKVVKEVWYDLQDSFILRYLYLRW